MNITALNRGVFVVSLDLELSWGALDLTGRDTIGVPHPASEVFLRTREIVMDALLELFREYQVPATWAIVGHLFLAQCAPVNGVKHPDMPRPTHSWCTDDWYARDPASNIEANPTYYGRDIVERIMTAEPEQEIGCHSFSHVIFGDAGCSEEVAEAEVRKCVALAKDLGLELKSFIFPRSQEGHHQVLRRHGFSCYRTARPGWFNAFAGGVRGLARLINDLLAISPSSAVVERQLNGLWSISTSTYYRSVYGVGRLVPIRSRVRQCTRGIDKAIETATVFHLCLHPWSLAVETERLLDGLRSILRYASQRSQEGKLDFLSMAQLAERLEAGWCGPPEDVGRAFSEVLEPKRVTG